MQTTDIDNPFAQHNAVKAMQQPVTHQAFAHYLIGFERAMSELRQTFRHSLEQLKRDKCCCCCRHKRKNHSQAQCNVDDDADSQNDAYHTEENRQSEEQTIGSSSMSISSISSGSSTRANKRRRRMETACDADDSTKHFVRPQSQKEWIWRCRCKASDTADTLNHDLSDEIESAFKEYRERRHIEGSLKFFENTANQLYVNFDSRQGSFRRRPVQFERVAVN